MQDVYYINADVYYFSFIFYIYIKYGYSNFFKIVFAFMFLHFNFEKKTVELRKTIRIDRKTSVDDVTREINYRKTS